MLIAILGYLIFSMFGADTPLRGAVEAMQDRLETAVADDGRHARLDGILQGVIDKLEATEEPLQQRQEQLFEELRRHDATRASIDAILEDLATERNKTQALLLDMRFALRAELSREEWALLFPPQ